MNRLILIFLLSVIWSSGWSASAQNSVKVIALFTNKAMLNINGQSIIMQKGDTIQGVTLLSASGRAARIRFEDGSEKMLGLNRSIQQAYKKPQNSKLTLYSDSAGMFTVSGEVNGKNTPFLLDTGATYIALSSDEADRLKLPYQSARKGAVQTASEVVAVWHIKLDQVKVGDISVPNVDAVVLQGNNPRPALLGMSFLKHVKLHRNGAAMVIEQKY
ncbi:MAG: retroviral-like aspartic protease family protein [Gammaproteobacteria bacterium]|nr:retroviral-like aspartic protease family protein [Gammaproteobacteria bacterium]